MAFIFLVFPLHFLLLEPVSPGHHCDTGNDQAESASRPPNQGPESHRLTMSTNSADLATLIEKRGA